MLVFVLGKPFQSIQMFVEKARSLPQRGAPERLALALLAKIRLCWRDLTWTKAAAFYEHL